MTQQLLIYKMSLTDDEDEIFGGDTDKFMENMLEIKDF